MTCNTIYDMNISIAYITGTHRFTEIYWFEVLIGNTRVIDITFTYNSWTNKFTGSLGWTSLLTLLTLQVLLTLLENTAITGLHWYKRFTCRLTLDETAILLAVIMVTTLPTPSVI